MKIKRRIRWGRQCGAFLLAGALTICIPGILQAQAAPGATAQTAAPPLPGGVPQDPIAPAATGPPAQPGRLLGDTISAPPLTVGGKFRYRVYSLFGPRGLVGIAIGAAISTGFDSPREWGQGASGYGLQYANVLGIDLTHQAIAFGLDSALHEDPRYFPSQKRGFIPRMENVLKQTVICKRDDGSDGVAYGRLISDFAAGQIASAWQPPSTRGVGYGFERGALIVVADGTVNLVQEFIPFTRPPSIRHRH